MKPVTVDMLRAHLIAASLTAMGAEALAWTASVALPVSQQAFTSTQLRLLAVAAIICGVILIRRAAHTAFKIAVRQRDVLPNMSPSRPVSVMAQCPRRRLVILHLRLTGRPFVLAEH